MDDETLLSLLRRNPEEGMNQLMKRYSGLVLSIIRTRLAEVPAYSTDAEECAADTFLKFYRSLPSFDPQKASVETYLGVIARRTAANKARERLRSAVDPDGEDAMAELRDEEEEDGQAALLLGEVRRMPPPDGDILFRKYYLGQSSAQIAAALGLSVSNVDTRVHRAVLRLKEKLGGSES